MFPIDPLWIYILVPVALVITLVLIRLWQEKMDKRVVNTSTEEREEEDKAIEALSNQKEVTATDGVVQGRVEKKPANAKSSEKEKPRECPHYLGYLFMKRGNESTYIPNECYGCRKLLQCLYSPNVMEKVYGE
jgi:hypothetical protein